MFMTTTPSEPVEDPNIVPGTDPDGPTVDPAAPGGPPDVESDPQTDPPAEGPSTES